MRFLWILRTLLSHWRRQPLQFAALMAGLAVATALWSGVQALNAQARDSYDRAASVLGGPELSRIVPAAGGEIARDDYVALRRAGWLVSPVLEGTARIGGRGFRIVGIDALTLPPQATGGGRIDSAERVGAFLRPPWLAIGAPATLAALEPGTLPERLADEDLPEGMLILDIAAAQQVLDRPGAITRLVVADTQRPGLPAIDELTGGRLEMRAPDPEPELARLTDSFHMNLTAFGLLSFVVGLFIVHATIGLAFEQRRAMFRTLRACGTSERALYLALIAELAAVALVAGLIGMGMGYALAAMLLPDVAASLRGLYGAGVAGSLNLRASWYAAGLAMTLGGAAVAGAGALMKLHRMPVLAPANAEAWRAAQLGTLRWQGALATLLLVAALGFAVFGDGLIAGFALMAALLMGAALALPLALAGAVELVRARARGPITGWVLAETRAQIGGMSLALMALLLALAINIGVGTMVSSFRETFLGYLDQRLAADVYVRGRDQAEADALRDRLAADPGVVEVLPIFHTDLDTQWGPVELFGFRDAPLYRENWPLLEAGPDAWDRVAGGTAVLVSEQLFRHAGLSPGTGLVLPAPGGGVSVEVAGVYPDYGNPLGQMMIGVDALQAHWPGADRTRFGAVTETGAAPEVIDRLAAEFAPEADQFVDQAGLKAFSRQIFERTFAVTLALNLLTFAVAGLAILTSVLTLAEMRLPQIAPVWAIGATRARLAKLELLRTALMALATAVLAVPLGLAVAWVLLAVVNVEAFGWRIPLLWYPLDWLKLTALAVGVAVIATALPALRLRRTPPAKLLRVFADAR